MTREDVIRMAREAGGGDMQPYDYGAKPDRMILFYDELVSLAYKIVAAEREACAKLVEQAGIDGYGTLAIAAMIRAKEKK